MSARKVQVQVWFRGRVTLEIDPAEYPQYFKNDEARGGLSELTKDLFYDEAQLRYSPFVDGSSEFTDAFFDDPEEVSS